MILKLKSIYPILVFLLIATILVSFWFKDGNIMATAESGIPFYNPKLHLDINGWAWANFALGYPGNISTASIPSYFLLTFLSHGILPNLVQAGFFWIVLVISAVSIYFLTKNLFPSLDNKFLILSIAFYWFNPFSMVNIWNRFLNNFLVFYMLLPTATYLFLKGLQTQRYVYVLFIGLTSAIFSYALTSIAFNLLFWFVLFYISVFYFFVSTDLKQRFFIIKFFILSMFFWGLTNLWWISQTFNYVYSGSFSAVQQASFSSGNNLQILTTLSRKLGNLIYLLRFEHASFFSVDSDIEWVKLYNFPPFVFWSFIMSLVIFLPLILKKKSNQVLLLGGLVILSIFLAKGNNSPFGELFSLAFVKFSFLQPFRNAFEKFGFILQLASAPLFAYGAYIIQGKVKKSWQKFIYLMFLLWFALLGFPYWTGLVFTGTEIPTNIPGIGYQVKVPDYYNEATKWLTSQGNSFRLIALPLGGEGITYKWDKGYAGVELSNQLLPTASVSFQTNIPFYNDISGGLEGAFLGRSDFTKIMNILNAKYVMLRNDIDWQTRRMRDPGRILQITKEKEKDGLLKRVSNFGALTFWENPKWVDRRIYSSNKAILTSKPKISDIQFLADDSSMLIGYNIDQKDIWIRRDILHPVAKFSLESNLKPMFEKRQDIFPHVRFSSGSKIYSLLLFKEELELDAIPDLFDRLDFAIQLLGKRLVEAKSEAELNNPSGVLTALRQYEHLLEKVESSIFKDQQLITDSANQLIKQEELYFIFLRHKAVLMDLINRFSDNKMVLDALAQTQKLIDAKLIKVRIQPTYGFKEGNEFPIKKRIVHKFNVINKGEYELLWGNASWSKYYRNATGMEFLQTDDQLISKKATFNESGLRTYGKINLTSGIHEIGINTPDEINLVDAPSEINLKVQYGSEQRSFPIKDYEPDAVYTLVFDYWIKTGSGVQILVEANNAKINLGETEADFSKFLGQDNYDFKEKHFSSLFKLNGSADAAKLIFKVKPWNDCESVFFTRNKDQCKDENFRRPYDRSTEVVIKNISITRNLVDEPILVKSNSVSSVKPPQITFEKINPTKYVLDITDAKEPYVIVLSELFDPGWKIFTSAGSELKGKHFQVNAYANGWQVDKAGSYKLTLKFVPQDLLPTAEKVSATAFTIGGIMIIWSLRRKYVKKS